MITVSKSKLKAKMLEFFRRVEETQEELIVTDNRKPVLKIVPLKKNKPVEDVFADVRGKVIYFEDVRTSTSGEWSTT